MTNLRLFCVFFLVADFLADSLEDKRSMCRFTLINVLLLIFYRQIVAR